MDDSTYWTNLTNSMIMHRIQTTIGGHLAAALLLIAAVSVQSVTAQSSDDRQADRDGITAAALNYAEGWYEGNADRMEAALHPELAKRAVFPTSWGGQELNQMSALTLINGTARGGGKKTPEEEQLKEVTIFDVYGDVATAKVVMADWTDYLHLAKWNGEWKIVNVLWELTPEAKERMASR
jgi:hypothetical protein